MAAAWKARAPELPADRALWYAQGVKAGKIPAPEFVRKAADRLLYLAKGTEFDWDPENLNTRAGLLEKLPPPETIGPQDGCIVLLPAQCFMLAWPWALLLKGSGYRAIERMLYYVPRKAGKSTLAAGLATIEGAKPTGGATNIDMLAVGVNSETSSHVFRRTAKMLMQDRRQHGPFGRVFTTKVLKEEIYFHEAGTTFKQASAGSLSLEGHAATILLIDEISRMPDIHAVEAYASGQGFTPHRFLCCLSTSSDLPASALDTEVERSIIMLNSRKKKVRYIGLLYRPDADDPWDKPRTWAKINPRYNDPTGDLASHYASTCEAAKNDPEVREDFLLRLCNIPVNTGSKFMQEDEYKAIPKIPWNDWPGAGHENKLHFLGVDLGDSRDATALCLLSVPRDTPPPPEDEDDLDNWIPPDTWEARWRIFYPDGSGQWIDEGDTRVATLFSGGINRKYMRMAKQGYATICNGPLVSHAIVARAIRQVASEVKLQGIYTDPYHGIAEVQQLLPEELQKRMITVPKTYLMTSPATRGLEARVKLGGIAISDNPIVRDHLLNATCFYTDSGAVVLRKVTKTSQAHIDSADALVVAIAGRAWVNAKGDAVVGTPIRPINNPDDYELRDYILQF